MMHPTNPRSGYPPGYYGPPHGPPQHPGQLRPGYHHLGPGPGGSNPSFQSMTSHWNLPPTPMSHPGPAYHPHPSPSPSGGGGGGNSKSKYAHLGQYGLTIQQPKAPDKPLLPYMRYSRKMWEELKADGKKVWDVQTVGKIIGQKWREMSEEDKQPYCDEYEAEKLVYNEQMKVYRNSTAYKRWMEQKMLAEANRDASAHQSHQSHQPSQSSQYHTDYAPHSIIPRSNTDPRIMMQQQQQQQEDEEDEFVTKKQTSTLRFHRNHRLMLELFNDVSIPDVSKHTVTKNRFILLKKQVQSLQLHQKKLRNDVLKIDAHFEAKKRKFLDDSEKFRKDLKKIQDHPLTIWKKPPTAFVAIDLPEAVSNPAKYIKL